MIRLDPDLHKGVKQIRETPDTQDGRWKLQDLWAHMLGEHPLYAFLDKGASPPLRLIEGQLRVTGQCGCPVFIRSGQAFGVRFPVNMPAEARIAFLQELQADERIPTGSGGLRPKQAAAFAEWQQRYRNLFKEYPDGVPCA